MLGDSCRENDVRVTLLVTPLPPTEFDCGTGRECEATGDWDSIGVDCNDDDGGCTKKPRYTKPEEVHAFVSFAIAW